MKESISYTFILNIVIVFIAACGAIIAGIFSYYRAFQANKIIISEIEKYEGFNCVSEESIKRKLSGVAYNLPFDAECKLKYGNPCVTDEDKTYVITVYNLDYSFRIPPNAPGSNDITANVGDDNYTHRYQYGVYTYMYIDFPILSDLFKITVHAKTRELYEFRNLANVDFYVKDGRSVEYVGNGPIDLNMIPKDIRDDDTISQNKYTEILSGRLLENYVWRDVSGRDDYAYGFSPTLFGNGLALNEDTFNAREAFRYGAISLETTQHYMKNGKFECGYVTDWSLF